jgi:hypothetical protein
MVFPSKTADPLYNTRDGQAAHPAKALKLQILRFAQNDKQTQELTTE